MVVLDWPGALALRKDMSKWDMFFSSHSTRFDPFINNFYFLPQTTFFAYNNPEMASRATTGMIAIVPRFTWANTRHMIATETATRSVPHWRKPPE